MSDRATKELAPASRSLGRYSAILAALVWMGACGGAVGILSNQLFLFKSPTGQLLLASWLFGSLGMALVGVGLAVVGLMQSGHGRTLAILGFVFNSLVLLGGLGVLFMASR